MRAGFSVGSKGYVVTGFTGTSILSDLWEYTPCSTAATITPGGPTTFCSGNSVALNANTGTGFLYQWKNNGVIISGATSSSYTVPSSGNYTVIVTSSSCGSATSSATVVTLSTAVPAQPAGISATGGNTKMCPGDTKVYSISTVTGATSYTWTPPVGATPFPNLIRRSMMPGQSAKRCGGRVSPWAYARMSSRWPPE